jgi:queuosine precursor transporter
MQQRRVVLTALFLGTIVGANWALSRYGIVPIGFGVEAPAGVFFAGLAFGLRDALHELSRRWVLAAIAVGAGLSWFIEPAFAVASGVAFAVSELADFAVYDPLRTRNWPVAVALSNVVGSVVDSALFLWLAFGSLMFIEGQILGKLYMVAAAYPFVWWARQRRPQVAVA